MSFYGSELLVYGSELGTVRICDRKQNRSYKFSEKEGVSALATTEDNSIIIGSPSGCLSLYRNSDGQYSWELKWQVEAHNYDVAAVVVDEHSKRIITGGGDGGICVWDLETGRLICKQTNFAGIQAVVCLSSAKIATAEGDRFVKIWTLPPSWEERRWWMMAYKGNKFFSQLPPEIFALIAYLKVQ